MFKVLHRRANFDVCQNQFNLNGAALRDWEASGNLEPQTCSAKDSLCMEIPFKGCARGKDEEKMCPAYQVLTKSMTGSKECCQLTSEGC